MLRGRAFHHGIHALDVACLKMVEIKTVFEPLPARASPGRTNSLGP